MLMHLEDVLVALKMYNNPTRGIHFGIYIQQTTDYNHKNLLF